MISASIPLIITLFKLQFKVVIRAPSFLHLLIVVIQYQGLVSQSQRKRKKCTPTGILGFQINKKFNTAVAPTSEYPCGRSQRGSAAA